MVWKGRSLVDTMGNSIQALQRPAGSQINVQHWRPASEIESPWHKLTTVYLLRVQITFINNSIGRYWHHVPGRRFYK